jgi:PEP-CTERM motif
MKLLNTVIAALALVPLASQANLLVNGDFENIVPSTGWSSTATTGFQDINTYRACCAPNGNYASGANVAFFGWDNLVGGTIWQDIATTVGQIYTLSFDYGAIARPRLQTMTVSALGGLGFSNVLASANLNAVGSNNLSTITSPYSYTFIADSTNTRILFADTSALTASVDGVIDNVAVNVPLPATFALFGLGLVGMGFLQRRMK